jgi:hypothetical protein
METIATGRRSGGAFEPANRPCVRRALRRVLPAAAVLVIAQVAVLTLSAIGGIGTAAVARAAGFGFAGVDGQVVDQSGGPFTRAGGHPYAVQVQLRLNHHLDTNPTDLFPLFGGGQVPDGGNPKDVIGQLPPGLVGNPTGLAQCTSLQLAGGGPVNPLAVGSAPTCPLDSQVGVITLYTQATNPGFILWQGTFPIYNMVPRPSVPASFGFQVEGTPVVLDATVRSDGDYGLNIEARDIPEAFHVWGMDVTFWGVPTDPSHDAQRCDLGGFGFQTVCDVPHASGLPATALVRLPTRCTPAGTGLETTFSMDSWENPGTFTTASFFTHLPPNFPDPVGPQQGPTACDSVPFTPTFTATPIGPKQAATPTAFRFTLTLPQSDDPTSTGEGDVRKVSVTLPEGVRVSPPSAQGLGGCAPSQIGLLGTGFADPNPIRFSKVPATCPDSSKLGTVLLDTPLLPKPLSGAIYLATPDDNPFHSLLALYLVVDGPGFTLKLPGRVSADASTGQLTATFDNNPQLPFSSLQLDFAGGPRAALVTPPSCGSYTTHALISSWSGSTVASDSTFALDRGPDGSPCAPQGFSPSFTAGTEDTTAAGETSFALLLSRSDSDQELGSVGVDMPGGLLGKIANAVLCADAQANAGTCGGGSKVGNVKVSAGAGSNPFWITNGRAYLTGPYHAAPFGLSMVVPAVAGPFNLGNVVVRSRILIDRHTAALKVISDPLPTILQGIPLDVRDVRVEIDRPHFIVNPTSCVEKHVFGTITSVLGAVAHASSRFQVRDCVNLPFAPKMLLSVGGRGHTGAGVSTRFTTTLTQTPGQANLRAVTVTLPTTLNALLAVLNRACTQAQFAANHCGGARAGSAVAVTPLLRDPLRGSVFFVRNPHRLLPDLVVALRGQVDIDLVGKVGVNPRTNQLTTKFDTIPDTAIKKFVLRLVAGANGPLGTTTNLCSRKARRATASVGFRGQNGKVVNVRQRLHVLGCPRRR